MLLGCRIAEIPLNIFISRMNGRPVHLHKMRTGCIFRQLVLLFFFFWVLQPGVICVTFHDWSAARSSTNRCNCLRKSQHLSQCLKWAQRADSTKQTLVDFSLSLLKKRKEKRKLLQQKSKRMRKRWCQWRAMKADCLFFLCSTGVIFLFSHHKYE